MRDAAMYENRTAGWKNANHSLTFGKDYVSIHMLANANQRRNAEFPVRMSAAAFLKSIG